MVKHLLLKSILLLCALVAGSTCGWADTSTLTFTATCGGSGTADDDASWTITSDASESNYDSTRGIHYGTGSVAVSYLTLTTSDIPGTITQIVVNASGASGTTAKLDVKVGGNAFGTQQSLTSNAANYTLTGSASGAIEVKVSQSSLKKALYVKSIAVTYTTAAPTKVATPSITGFENFYPFTEVSISCSTDDAVIQYSTDNGTSWNNYTGAFNLTETTTVKAKATKDGLTASDEASKTFTKVTPLTVAEAIDATPASGTSEEVYISGIVSAFYSTNIMSDGNNCRYYISDDGTTTTQLLVYKGKGLNNVAFSNTDDLQIGDIIIIKGQLTTYSSEPEVAANNYIISLARKVKTPTFTPAASAVAAGTEVAINCTTDGATIYYTIDGTDPTKTSSVYSTPITVNSAMTIKAFAVKTGNPDSDIATAVYTVAEPVATPTFNPAAGTYYSTQSVTLSTETGGATIYYTTNGDVPTTSSTKYTGAIAVNETMTIKAIAIKDDMANSTVAEAAYTILTPAIMVSTSVSIEYDETNKILDVTYNHVDLEKPLSVKYYESDGTTETSYDWFTASINGENKLVISANENENTEANRIGYLKILAKAPDNSDVFSARITLTQKNAFVDYATLPFEYDGNGTGSLPKGLSQSGLTDKYSSSPKMKFDNTGDYIILKIKEIPGTLSFDIKGNSFSGGTFKVQTSADGISYTDLASYTTLGSTQSEEFNNLPANIRYIKWIYTNKSSGNVGLGNIKLLKTENINISNAKYATYSSTKALDFSASGITVFKAKADGTSVKLTAIEDGILPANTGVILYCETADTYTVPITTTDATISNNELVATTTRTLVTKTGGAGFNYILQAGPVFNMATEAGAYMPAGKAYLSTTVDASTSGARLNIIFDDATAINEELRIKNEESVCTVYNLNGQRVNKPGKGLYIVNGKKFIKN